MDLITYALCRKQSEGAAEAAAQKFMPSIGENGNWFIGDKDTGIAANKAANVDVDGVLGADSDEQEIFVTKDGVKTIVGNATSSIDVKEIGTLF